MGDTDQKVFSGSNLNDNKWHTITFQRRGKTVELGVDDSRPVIGKYHQAKQITNNIKIFKCKVNGN